MRSWAVFSGSISPPWSYDLYLRVAVDFGGEANRVPGDVELFARVLGVHEGQRVVL